MIRALRIEAAIQQHEHSATGMLLSSKLSSCVSRRNTSVFTWKPGTFSANRLINSSWCSVVMGRKSPSGHSIDNPLKQPEHSSSNALCVCMCVCVKRESNII
jgi:hypothetical protein